MSIETLRVHNSLFTNYTNPNNSNLDGDAILGTCNRARNAHTLRVLGLSLLDPGQINVTIS